MVTIGDHAFRGCDDLQNIVIPNNVKSIEHNAFDWCRNLQSVVISDSITSIERQSFKDCKNLRDVTVPNGVTHIDREAFLGCDNLQSVIIPDSVVSIGKNAFKGCKKLTVFCSPSKKLFKKSLIEKYCRKYKIKVQPVEFIPIEKIAAQPEEISLDGANADIAKKINACISEIDLFKNVINDACILGELSEIKNIFVKMTALVKEEEDIERRTEQLDYFLSYYFQTVKKILDSYVQIEKLALNVESAVETKDRIAESIPFIRKAFERELDNMYKNKMLDITTDIDMLETMLAKEGLLNDPLKIE